MNFTTKISIPKSTKPIDYNSKIVLLGSCFTESMGEKFEYFKFKNTVNPFGIIFNPVSIERLIERVVNQIQFSPNDIFFHNESWHCYEVHSELSHSNKNEFLKILNTIIEYTYQQITQSTHIIITYGTSWVYKLSSTNEVVANCHKIHKNQFNKEILSVKTIAKSIQNTIDLIQKLNPKVNFIFTISPVRHIKDGFVENQQSKAHLISALPSAIYHLESAIYFPSYEIMMDELRDYRFYAEDMLHPNQVAINYIWIKFFENFVNEKEFLVMQQVCDIQKSLQHKPFNPDSESHRQFLSKLQSKIALIQKQFPQIQF
jgi:hypothetical protein